MIWEGSGVERGLKAGALKGNKGRSKAWEFEWTGAWGTGGTRECAGTYGWKGAGAWNGKS